MITAYQAVCFGKLVEAIRRNEKIRWPEALEGHGIDGTLRHLSPSNGSAAHLPYDGDLMRAWVRITTKPGFEAWVRFTELDAACREGEAGISNLGF